MADRRVRSRIARCHLLLGNKELSAEFSVDLDESSQEAIVEQVAVEEDPAGFDGQIARLDAIYKQSMLAEIQASLGVLAALYARDYAIPERRAAIEQRVLEDWHRIDSAMRGKALMRMADAAMANGDSKTGVRLVEAYGKLLDETSYAESFELPELALVGRKLAELGDAAASRQRIDLLLTRFDLTAPLTVADPDFIPTMDRAKCIRPAAEAFHLLGNRDAAIETYQRVIDEFTANPNIRPRVDNLVDTCLSMAEVGFEPPNGDACPPAPDL